MDSPDLYDDSPMQGKPDMAADDKREQQDNQAAAVLPKDFFQGKDLKPGTECKVRIERVMDDEVQVSYVPHEDEGSDKGSKPPMAEDDMSAPMPNSMME